MKNIILIFTYIAIGALTLGILVSALGRESRNVELQSNLSNAVEESLANAMEEKNYTVTDQNEFLADVAENIAEMLDTNSTVDVKVMKSDLNKGLLSIRVTQSFGYVNGRTGTVSCDRTVLFDKKPQEDDEKIDIYYYISADDDRPYKRYTLLKGDTIQIPKAPSRAGYTFEGWKDADGNEPFSDATVDAEKTYVASWSGSGIVPASMENVEFEDFSGMEDGEGVLTGDGSITDANAGDGSEEAGTSRPDSNAEPESTSEAVTEPVPDAAADGQQ